MPTKLIMKKIVTVIVIFAFLFKANAQQDVMVSQYMFNGLFINPAYAGSHKYFSSSLTYRKQWVNFPGAPKTGLLSFDMPIGQLPLAIGLNVMSDQIGFAKTLFARLALSYNRHIGAGVLGIGIDGGILQQQFNGTWITPDGSQQQDAAIPAWQANGQATSNPNLNKLTYDVGFGAYYSIANKMYVGISSTHLAAQDIKASSDVKYALARHYYIVGGYTFDLTQEHAIQPNVKVKSDAASTQLDVNLTYIFNKTLSIGVSYRMQDAIAPMIGYRFLKDKSFRVGYSYDLTTSKIKGYSSGTHEISAGYCFNVKKPKKVTSYQNARFLD